MFLLLLLLPLPPRRHRRRRSGRQGGRRRRGRRSRKGNPESDPRIRREKGQSGRNEQVSIGYPGQIAWREKNQMRNNRRDQIRRKTRTRRNWRIFETNRIGNRKSWNKTRRDTEQQLQKKLAEAKAEADKARTQQQTIIRGTTAGLLLSPATVGDTTTRGKSWRTKLARALARKPEAQALACASGFTVLSAGS